MSAMNPPSKRQRIITGCQACRERHVKCDNDEPCRRCELHGIDCVRQVNVRFRSSTKSPLNIFPSGQKWLLPLSQVRYHDETSEVAQYYGQLAWEANAPDKNVLAYHEASGSQHNSTTTTSITNFEDGPKSQSRNTLVAAPSPVIESHTSVGSPAHSSPSQYPWGMQLLICETTFTNVKWNHR